MGCTSSKQQEANHLAFSEYILTSWKGFVGTWCTKDDTAYMPMQDIVSMFAQYLRTHPHISFPYCVHYATDYMPQLLEREGFQMTPGWVSPGLPFDTRLVLGVKVCRFSHYQNKSEEIGKENQIDHAGVYKGIQTV